MIFYHVSQDLTHNGNFYLKVPETRADDEDSKIKRICVGKSIEDCLSAMPDGGYSLDMHCYTELKGLFKVFKIDTDKIGINENDIILDDELYKTDLVRDALHTNECWLLKNFSVNKEDSFFIYLNDWTEESEDLVEYSLWNASMEGDGDYFSLYEEKYDSCFVPCIVVIENIKYLILNKEKIKAVTIIDNVVCYNLSNDDYYNNKYDDSVIICYYSDWLEKNTGPLVFFKEWAEELNIIPVAI